MQKFDVVFCPTAKSLTHTDARRKASSAGTDISFSIKGRTAIASKGLFHEKGESGNLLEDERVMETIHIALGNNITMAGTFNVPIYLDGVVKKPTVWMDGKILMKEGKLLI